MKKLNENLYENPISMKPYADESTSNISPVRNTTEYSYENAAEKDKQSL